jgi:hypothetical protein
MTSFAFRETLMSHLLLWGNAYAQILRNGMGEVIGLYPLMPNRMAVDRDTAGNLFYLYSRASGDLQTLKGTDVYLRPSDVLRSRLDMYRATAEWNRKLDPVKFVRSGEEPGPRTSSQAAHGNTSIRKRG